jgi:hypothetical protein
LLELAGGHFLCLVKFHGLTSLLCRIPGVVLCLIIMYIKIIRFVKRKMKKIFFVRENPNSTDK